MFLFLRLLLAHFLGDTLFQPDEVYEVKKKGFHGVALHVGIIFLTIVLFSFPYLKYPQTWAVLFFVGITHLVQDEVKIRVFTSQKHNFIIFILDQLMHILFTMPILLLSFANIPPEGNNLLYSIYNNTNLVVVFMGYVVSMFLGAYLWEAFKVSYIKNSVIFNKSKVKYGMFERFVITTALLSCFWYVILIPIIFRVVSKQLKFSSGLYFNIIYASLIGYLLKRFLPVF